MNAFALSSAVVLATCLWAFRGWVLHCLDLLLARLRGTSDGYKTNMYLLGKYAPVRSEETCSSLKIDGVMPAAMHGIYSRNGPNPQLNPVGGYHWFDGDGMTHTVRITSSGAQYNNRYTRTTRLNQERAAGWPLFSKTGDAMGAGYLVQMSLQWLKRKTGVINVSDGDGTGNTSLVYHARRLYALHEGDLPYALRVMCSGVIETLGRHTNSNGLQNRATAHPKIDHRTGEMLSFGYSLDKEPYLTVTTVDPKGAFVREVSVTIRRPVMMHDCAITEDYFIILDMPLFFEPERIMKNGTLPFVFDKQAGSRIGLLPRRAIDESDIKWFSFPSQMIFHTANAWQETSTKIKLVACCFEEFDLGLGAEKKRTDENVPRVHVMTLDLATGTATRRCLSSVPGDFPTINNRLVGYRSRYMYIAHLAKWQQGEPIGAFGGITKLDMWAADKESAVVGQLEFPADFVGGEPFFVPSSQAASQSTDDEDAGYLTTFITNDSGESRLVVYDARTMESAPVATVHIPCRVPVGFHGIHLNEEQLSLQRSS